MKSANGSNEIWGNGLFGPWIDKDDYLQHFLLPLWLQLRDTYAEKKSNLAINLAKIVGCENPTQGLSRAIVTLISHEVKKLPPDGPATTPRCPVAIVRPRGSVSSSLL
jgi:hypothetical protein